MARIKKKGTTGAAKNFITRTQAVRKLQISLPDFRRLCIFKGIYPREPRNKKKAAKNSTPSTTFYYVRDIQYLLHEPLLAKFREHKALAKKIGRALGRGEVGDAARLEKTQTPRITLDHIIKERYPTFIDALRDLDDALSMLYLFANLPSSTTMPPKTIALCQRLCHEFEHYLITTHSLRKSFLSIKGIYYQATIQGQDILWLVPYRFVQRITNDIDLRIMATFVEFYTTLMGFVNFRLYTTIGLVYPPKFDAVSADKGGELGAFQLQGRGIGSPQRQIESEPPNGTIESLGGSEATARAEAAVNAITSSMSTSQVPSDMNDEDDPTLEPAGAVFDTFTSTDPTADSLPQPDSTSTVAPKLFAPYTFYLSRETPRAPLEFLLRSFGCARVGWPVVLGDGAFTNDENDPRITHQIVDRPPMPVSVGQDTEQKQAADTDKDTAATQGNAPAGFAAGVRMPGRTYIQPQWVWDSINEARLLRPDLYAPGATLPPHLSPWVKPRSGEYDPRKPLAQDELEKDRNEEVEAERDIEAAAEILEEGDEDSNSDGDEEVDEGVESIKKIADLRGENGEDNEWGGLSGGEESESETENVGSAATSKSAPKSILKKTSNTANKGPELAEKKAQAKRQREEAEEKENRKMMMPRRKRKLYEKMEYSNARRDEATEKLTAKRRRVERERKAGAR